MSDRWTWVYAPGGVLQRYYHTPASQSLEVDPENVPIHVDFYSPANQPNSKLWEPLFPNEPGGDLTHIFLNLTTGLTDGTMRLTVERVDGFLAFKQSLHTSAFVPATAGYKAFQFQHPVQSSPSAADRYHVRFTFRNNTLNPETVVFGIGDSFLDLARSTILMANPEIVWNSNVLAFPGPLTDYLPLRRPDRVMDFSGGGVARTSLRHFYDWARIGLRRFTDVDFEAALWAWWSWAARGKPYAFALDSAEKVDRVLSGAAAASQKDVPMSDTSGISVGKKYLLRESAGDEFEIVHVSSISAGVKIVARDNLQFGYLTGDIFRSRDYFPKMVSLDDDRPFRENEVPTTFSLDHTMREDFG